MFWMNRRSRKGLDIYYETCPRNCTGKDKTLFKSGSLCALNLRIERPTSSVILFHCPPAYRCNLAIIRLTQSETDICRQLIRQDRNKCSDCPYTLGDVPEIVEVIYNELVRSLSGMGPTLGDKHANTR
jgi:hypothetical protein